MLQKYDEVTSTPMTPFKNHLETRVKAGDSGVRGDHYTDDVNE